MNHQNSSKSPLPRIKIFHLSLKYFAAAGIGPQLVTQACPLNGSILLGLLIVGSAFLCHLVCIFDKAKELSASAQSIYLCSLHGLIIEILLIIIFNVKNFFNTIVIHEDVVNTSEWNSNTMHFYLDQKIVMTNVFSSTKILSINVNIS